MFISDVIDMRYLLAAKAAAELAIKTRWELAHERELRDMYAQGRVGQNAS